MPDARSSLLVALGMLFSSCVSNPAKTVLPTPDPSGDQANPPETPAAAALPDSAGSVVLVTIDGVRWQEIFTGADPALADGAALPKGESRTARGLTPNLHRLFFDQGVVLGDPQLGERFTASGPNYVSLPGYLEMMMGAVSGCTGNECQPHVPWAIAGEFAHAAAPGEKTAAVFASWERIALTVPAGANGLLMRAGRTPDEQAPPYPGNGEYRPDQRTAALAIEHLVRHRPRFLWMALGDTDEWAHRQDYRGYVESLRFADDIVGELAAHLDEMGEYGARTTILVTTDHGRDPDFANHGSPASAGVWLMARGGRVGKRGPVALPRERHLRDIAPTIASMLGRPRPSCAGCGEVLDELL